MSGFKAEGGVLRRLADGKKLSHAYILTGSTGEARQALAVQLAAAWMCTSEGDRPCTLCAGCRKVLSGIHPDVEWVRVPEGKREITVDQVRALRAGAYIRPNEGARKVYLVERADAMNDSAQNAMLKLLEDGPAYASFLLLAENAWALLPTVRSRCEILTMTPEKNEHGGEIENQAAAEAAAQLAGHILAFNRQGLAECAAALEGKKWDKDALLALLDGTAENLYASLTDQPALLLPWLDHVKRLRQAAQFNTGAGHLLGWLAAGPDACKDKP